MSWVHAGEIKLQATLSAGSAMSSLPAVLPHHPITCTGRLFLHEDGRFECEHAETEPGDRRTLSCIQSSIAMLIIEMAVEKYR